MNIVLFKKDEFLKPLPVHDPRAEHIRKILHKKAGDTFEAGIINGEAGTAYIESVTEQGYICTFTPQSQGKPLFPLVLITGFPRPIQLKRLLRDVSSLGVCAVHLTVTQLGEKSYLKSTLIERGAALEGLIDGAAQAKTTYIPQLFMHQSLKECFRAIAELQKEETFIKPRLDSSNCIKLLLDNVKPWQRLSDMAYTRAFTGKTIIAAIGSERGWTDSERDSFVNSGFIPCSLGERILRTETASVTAVSLILAGMNVI